MRRSHDRPDTTPNTIRRSGIESVASSVAEECAPFAQVEHFEVDLDLEAVGESLRFSELEKERDVAKEREEDIRCLSEDELDRLQEAELRAKVKIPYLPDIADGMEYTLVLDLDETLIHFEFNENDEEDEEYYLIRPGCIKFLFELSKYFELVIFTAAVPEVSL